MRRVRRYLFAPGCFNFVGQGLQLLPGDDEALWPQERDQARIDGEPQNSSRPAFAAGLKHCGDQIAKHQRLLISIAFQDRRRIVIKHKFPFVFLFSQDI